MKMSLSSWLGKNSSLLSSCRKAVASSKKKSSFPSKKETLEAVHSSDSPSQFKRVSYTETQAFTDMITLDGVQEWLFSLPKRFKQCDLLLSDGTQVYLRFIDDLGNDVSVHQKKATALTQLDPLTHNRVKAVPIRENESFMPFVHLGIMDKEGRVKSSMRHKFTQVNSFISLMEDAIDHFFKTHDSSSKLQIIDVGCGKGYLTVAMAVYFDKKYPGRVEVLGVDSRDDVIDTCKRMLSSVHNLSFYASAIGQIEDILSDVNSTPNYYRAIVALHACNTASDVALFKAIKLKASMFFVAPCCQAEIASKLNPIYLQFATRHPTLKQKISALLTDALRASLMEEQGWKVDVIEFVDPEHTPKNTLLRGQWTGKRIELSQSAQELLEHLEEPPLLKKLLFSLY